MNPPGRWKILVVDEHSQRLIGSVLKQFDILEENVTRTSFCFLLLEPTLNGRSAPTMACSSTLYAPYTFSGSLSYSVTAPLRHGPSSLSSVLAF